MPLNSVQQYVKGLLNNLPVQLFNLPLTAYIAPPVQASMDGPTAFIWGSTWDDRRQTAPRPQAFKKVIYQLEIYLKVPDAADYFLADSAFPALIDNVVHMLNTTPMPVTLTDSVTNQQSQLIAIGETIAGDYSTLHVLDDQRYVLYECLLRCQIEEVVSYGS